MMFNYLFAIFIVVLASDSIVASFLKSDEDDVCYIAEFTDDVKECENFDNKLLKTENLNVGIVSSEDCNVLGLNGKITIQEDGITEGLRMCLKAYKVLDIGKEFLYEISDDVCSNLNNEDAPWYPMLKALNVTQCPIPAKTYIIEDLTISLEYAKDIMRHEFCGEYEIHMSFCNDKLQEKSCHIMQVSLTEVKC